MNQFIIRFMLCCVYLLQGETAKLPSTTASNLRPSLRPTDPPLSPSPPYINSSLPPLPLEESLAPLPLEESLSPLPEDSELISPESQAELERQEFEDELERQKLEAEFERYKLQAEREAERKELEAKNEDQETVNKTIEKYGFPKDFTILELPGAELSVDNETLLIPSKLLPNETGFYTLKIRTVTEFFSYNGRYEESKLKQVGDQQIPIVKGQFGEHFKRKSGGYYIRTIGYTLDENGYEQFLIDLTKAQTTTFEEPVVISSLPGGPPPGKKPISSTVLGSLIGGNSIG